MSGRFPDAPPPTLFKEELRMTAISGRFVRNLSGLFLSLLVLSSCSDSGTGPIKDLGPFVGVWEAETLTLYNPDNPSQGIDLVEQGGSYVLSILGTGQYTAVFDLLATRGFQAGTIKVAGDRITLTPATPPGPATSGTWRFEESVLVVTAEILFDFDEDGDEEVVGVAFSFVPRDLQNS